MHSVAPCGHGHSRPGRADDQTCPTGGRRIPDETACGGRRADGQRRGVGGCLRRGHDHGRGLLGRRRLGRCCSRPPPCRQAPERDTEQGQTHEAHQHAVPPEAKQQHRAPDHPTDRLGMLLGHSTSGSGIRPALGPPMDSVASAPSGFRPSSPLTFLQGPSVDVFPAFGVIRNLVRHSLADAEHQVEGGLLKLLVRHTRPSPRERPRT